MENSNTHEEYFQEITPETYYFCDAFGEIDGFDVRILVASNSKHTQSCTYGNSTFRLENINILVTQISNIS